MDGGETTNEFVLPTMPSSSDSSVVASDEEQENIAPAEQEALRIVQERQRKRKMETALGPHHDIELRARCPAMAPPPFKKGSVQIQASAPAQGTGDPALSLPDTPVVGANQLGHPSHRRSVQGNAKLLLDLQQKALEEADEMKLQQLAAAEQAYRSQFVATNNNAAEQACHTQIASARLTATANNDGWGSNCKTPSGQRMKMIREPQHDSRPVYAEELQQAAIESEERKKMILEEAARLSAEKKELTEKKKKAKMISKMLDDSDDTHEFFCGSLSKIDNGASAVKKHATEKLKAHLAGVSSQIASQVIDTIGGQIRSNAQGVNEVSSNLRQQGVQLNHLELDMVLVKQDVNEIKDILANKCPHKDNKTGKNQRDEAETDGVEDEQGGGQDRGNNNGAPPTNQRGGSGRPPELFNSMNPVINITNNAKKGANDNAPSEMPPLKPEKKKAEPIEPANRTQAHKDLGEIELAVGKASGLMHHRLHDPLLRRDARWCVHPEQKESGVLIGGLRPGLNSNPPSAVAHWRAAKTDKKDKWRAPLADKNDNAAPTAGGCGPNSGWHGPLDDEKENADDSGVVKQFGQV